MNLWVLYAAISILSAVKVQGQTCGVVGTNAPEQQANRNQGFYLNTQEPAPCSGTVNEFQYCYYRPNLGLTTSYHFTFAVYRETSPGSGSYSPVSEAFTVGININIFLGSGTFACATFPVKAVQVATGDVLGACIYDPPDNVILLNRVQLDVVGNNAGTSRFLMSTGNSGCGDSTVPDPVSSLSMTNSLVLHIYAEITPLDQPSTAPMVGTTPSLNTTATTTVTMAATDFIPGTIFTENGTTLLNESQTSTNIAGIIAAVIVLLVVLLVVATVVTIIILALFLAKRSKRGTTVAEAQVDIRSGIEILTRGSDSVEDTDVQLTETNQHSLKVGVKLNEAYGIRIGTEVNSACEYEYDYIAIHTAQPQSTVETQNEFGLNKNEAYGVSRPDHQTQTSNCDEEYDYVIA